MITFGLTVVGKTRKARILNVRVQPVVGRHTFHVKGQRRCCFQSHRTASSSSTKGDPLGRPSLSPGSPVNHYKSLYLPGSFIVLKKPTVIVWFPLSSLANTSNWYGVSYSRKSAGICIFPAVGGRFCTSRTRSGSSRSTITW